MLPLWILVCMHTVSLHCLHDFKSAGAIARLGLLASAASYLVLATYCRHAHGRTLQWLACGHASSKTEQSFGHTRFPPYLYY